jgi:hypothetical protein
LTRRRPILAALAAVVCTALCALANAGPAAAASQPLQTAVADGVPFREPDLGVAMRRVRGAGATAVRFFVSWRSVSAPGSTKPDGFNPRDPADPQYYWTGLDAQVKAAVANGLQPILCIAYAPAWAEQGPESEGPSDPPYFGAVQPDPTELGYFAEAAARRYSGSFAGLPRVRYWQVWNEPNLFGYLDPQYYTPLGEMPTAESAPRSPDLYLPMVNNFAAGVHGVHRDNLVIAGGTAPFGRWQFREVQPLVFMRQLLCMTDRDRPQPGCTRRVSFDVWAHDPYTQGGPQHRAQLPGNVSIGDLGRMRRTLVAAAKAGRIASNGPVRFWVTEFSWDTKPPDPAAVPLKLHTRWIAEALYRMWLDGVSLVTWFQIRDEYRPGVADPKVFQSGLYFACKNGIACDRPKPSLSAFRFPFVAFWAKGKILVWGRTPAGKRGKITVQRRSGRRWLTVATLRTDRYGIFTTRFAGARKGELRASLGGARSPSWTLGPTPDRQINPFG